LLGSQDESGAYVGRIEPGLQWCYYRVANDPRYEVIGGQLALFAELLGPQGGNACNMRGCHAGAAH
jgi:hypothetical protein